MAVRRTAAPERAGTLDAKAADQFSRNNAVLAINACSYGTHHGEVAERVGRLLPGGSSCQN